MKLFVSTIETPFGPFSLGLDAAGAVAAAAFGDMEALRKRVPHCDLTEDPAAGRAAAAQLLEYFDGRRTRFDVPLAPVGTPFQQRAWTALRRIPFGTTCSYGELARKLQTSPRAVGRANATNPVCVFVPCHRVIGLDGSMTGFAFGAAVKRRLLAHESAVQHAGRVSVPAAPGQFTTVQSG